jgi:RecB family exonuclease
MKPKSFSATALEVAELCPARYGAENVARGRGIENNAAGLGSSVHDALENFVKLCHLDKSHEPTLALLLDLYKMGYMTIMGTTDFETEDFYDGEAMLKKWFARTDFSSFEVISCEIKENFVVNTSQGPIPFNYIWDRHDRLDETTLRIVDYKSNRWGINADDLRKKVQARCYALAAAIKYKDQNYEKIWVEFDMLRHDGPVGVLFTREDNAATWSWLKQTAERILAMDENNLEERLNPNCNWCVRKASCGALHKNVAVGGIMAIGSAVEAVDQRAALEYQKKGIQNLIDELDTIILAEAKKKEVFEFESDLNKLSIGVSSRRTADAERVEQVIGERLFLKYGGKSITVTNIEKMCKSPDLTDEQKKQVRSLIYKKTGEPSVKVSAKNPITGD